MSCEKVFFFPVLYILMFVNSIHGVAKSQMGLSNFHFTLKTIIFLVNYLKRLDRCPTFHEWPPIKFFIHTKVWGKLIESGVLQIKI